jgi:hypothetical protein
VVEDEQPNANARKQELTAYPAFVQLAVHGQENKWWMLYIFLMFNSILLLGCATVIAADPYQWPHRTLLYAFSLVGVAIDGCWIVMARDYDRASKLYSELAVKAEQHLPDVLPKPLTEREKQRASKSSLGSSGFISQLSPALLIAIYVALLTIAWCRPTSQ